MPDKKRRVLITVACLFAVAALFLGLFVSQHLHLTKRIDVSKFHGTFLDKPREISSFALTGIDNMPFNNTSLQGHWTLVFFGFTNCGMVCPTTMAELAKMYHLLQEKGVKTLPQVVMISVDPERDNLDKLNNYVKAFDPNFYGARGDEDAIKKITKELGIAYTKVTKDTEGAQVYDIEHTGAVMLINPKGDLSAFFTTPHRATLLAKDYMLLVS